MIVAANSRFGGVDVLVNNAGVIQVGPIEVMTHEDFELAMQAHFWGPLNTIMATLPSMRQRGTGRVASEQSAGRGGRARRRGHRRG